MHSEKHSAQAHRTATSPARASDIRVLPNRNNLPDIHLPCDIRVLPNPVPDIKLPCDTRVLPKRKDEAAVPDIHLPCDIRVLPNRNGLAAVPDIHLPCEIRVLPNRNRQAAGSHTPGTLEDAQ
jgi:hypothetical protein